MGWRQAFVAIAVAGTWGLWVSAGRAAPQTADWFLIKLTAGPAGASNVVARTSTSGTFVGSGPRVFGSGIATPGGSAVGAFDLGAGDTSITTTKGLGSQQATVLPARNGQFSL